MADTTAPSFDKLVCKELAVGLRSMGIIAPNKIQADAIPLALSGRDLMVVAQTGSGKTLMFLLPIMQRLAEAPAHPQPLDVAQWSIRPEALAIVPNGDLAMQVASVAEELAAALPSRPVVEHLTGPGAHSLSKSCARLLVLSFSQALALISTGDMNVERLRILAVDEADAVLLEGNRIAPEADAFLRKLEKDCEPLQIFLTMAHLSEAKEAEMVRRFPHAQRILHSGVLVPTLRQSFHYFRDNKDSKLLTLLANSEKDPWMRDGTVLIFCASAQDAPRIRAAVDEAMPLSKPVALHDGIEADQRAQVFQSFRSGDSRVLVATDSAARGLDFPRLRHVILYDVPSDVTAFVHCAGRTARRGQSGLVTCLVQTHEAQLYQFEFQSHHALQPAEQLDFLSVPAEPRATIERDDNQVGQRKKKEKKKLCGELKELRLDPLDRKRYTFEQLERYYRCQYSKAEILSYWEHECTPVLARPTGE